MKTVSIETHFGQGEGVVEWLYVQVSRRITQHDNLKYSIYYHAAHTEKRLVNWANLHLRVLNLLLRSPCGLSLVYSTMARLSSWQSLSLP